MTPKGLEVRLRVSRMASRRASGEGWVRAVRMLSGPSYFLTVTRCALPSSRSLPVDLVLRQTTFLMRTSSKLRWHKEQNLAKVVNCQDTRFQLRSLVLVTQRPASVSFLHPLITTFTQSRTSNNSFMISNVQTPGLVSLSSLSPKLVSVLWLVVSPKPRQITFLSPATMVPRRPPRWQRHRACVDLAFAVRVFRE